MGLDKPQTQTDPKLDAITQAASEVFIENGYHLAKMDDIAKKAGTTKRTIYKKFDSKEKLFKFILKDMIDTAYARITLEYDPDKPFREQLNNVLNRSWDVVSDDRLAKIKRVLIAEHIREPDFMRDILNDGWQRDEGLYAWMESAIQAGHVKDCDKYMASEFVIALIEHFAQIPQYYNARPPKTTKKESILAEIGDMFICKYGAQQ